jgi:hypothetical protein
MANSNLPRRIIKVRALAIRSLIAQICRGLPPPCVNLLLLNLLARGA